MYATKRYSEAATGPQERLSRLGVLREPVGYVDGENLFQFVGSCPTGFLDPFGLAEEPIQANPVEFDDNHTVDLPTEKADEKFLKYYVKSATWGTTKDDGIWDDGPNGTYVFKGKIVTVMWELVVPQTLPPCVKKELLQQAIGKFNNRALQHEKEVQQWFREKLAMPRKAVDQDAAAAQFKAEKDARYGGEAEYELREQIEMYTLLREAYKLCHCKGDPDPNVDFDMIIQKKQKLLENKKSGG